MSGGGFLLSSLSRNSYKINHNSDKVGVFVSIVSTKIPFKAKPPRALPSLALPDYRPAKPKKMLDAVPSLLPPPSPSLLLLAESDMSAFRILVPQGAGKEYIGDDIEEMVAVRPPNHHPHHYHYTLNPPHPFPAKASADTPPPPLRP